MMARILPHRGRRRKVSVNVHLTGSGKPANARTGGIAFRWDHHMFAANILAAATPATVVQQPYAHMAREAVLPEADYAALAATFPDSATILGGRTGRENSAARLPAFKVLDNPAIAPAWRDFFAFHTSQAFWSEIVRVFAPSLREALPGLEANAGRPMEEWTAAPRGTRDEADVRLECQFVINTP